MIERVDKPWGGTMTFVKNENVTVNILKIENGHETSVHSHINRDEDIYVLKGKVRIHYGHGPKEKLETVILGKGGGIVIARSMLHGISALDDTLILEISHGEYNEEDKNI